MTTLIMQLVWSGDGILIDWGLILFGLPKKTFTIWTSVGDGTSGLLNLKIAKHLQSDPTFNVVKQFSPQEMNLRFELTYCLVLNFHTSLMSLFYKTIFGNFLYKRFCPWTQLLRPIYLRSTFDTCIRTFDTKFPTRILFWDIQFPLLSKN